MDGSSDMSKIIIVVAHNQTAHNNDYYDGGIYDDYVTKHMIQQFILDEQEHFNWVRQHLNLIEEIGYENYLIEQLGE